GSLSGGIGADLFGSEGGPCGVALNSAAGKIYWANFNGGEIRVGNIDGSGGASTLIAGQDHPCGVAVDPAAGRIYWAEFCQIPGPTCGTIRGADLSNVSGTAETLVDGEAGPSGVTVDPAAGKIYWTNQSPNGTPPGSVRRANLDGTGVETVVDNQANPIGVAIDAGKIYWANLGPCCSGPGAIRVADLANVSGTTTTLFSGELGPAGVAIDPTASPSPQIYWGTFGGGTVRAGNLDGSGGASTLISGESFANFPVLLRAPTGTEPPAISSGVGGELTCSQGSWAPDLLASFLFRAPATFAYQWKRNGANIATGATFTPTEPGDYTCTVTATNQAGSASQTSVAFNVPVPEITELSPAHGWIGLKNSDDQGTQFDLRAELLKNGTPVASGLKRCITGVTRNPALATEAVVPWDAFAPVSTSPGDTLSLRFSTRIGTNPADTSKCAGPGGSHSNAVGLRLYYGSATRPSAFDVTIDPSPSQTLYLGSNGSPCANQESTGVTSRFLDSTSPSAANAKCKDSAAVKFGSGNAWKEIGTWYLDPLP
ncbi:MAG: hypothetical protein WA701_00870, partial [Solirubrobacterales bacterium]